MAEMRTREAKEGQRLLTLLTWPHLIRTEGRHSLYREQCQRADHRTCTSTLTVNAIR